MNEKEAEIAKKHDLKVVHEFTVYPEGEEPATVYLREPTYAAKKAAMNKSAMLELMDAGEIILETSIIKEESDKRWERDDVKLGLCAKVFKLAQSAALDQKKSLSNSQ